MCGVYLVFDVIYFEGLSNLVCHPKGPFDSLTISTLDYHTISTIDHFILKYLVYFSS